MATLILDNLSKISITGPIRIVGANSSKISFKAQLRIAGQIQAKN
jgi:hypothetical protein